MKENKKKFDVLIEWMEGNPDAPDSSDKYYALINNYTMTMGIKGCPMGRATTKEGAIKDLIYRVKIENGFTLIVGNIIIR